MTGTNRNELCPCGSGKKSKKCCAANSGSTFSRGGLLALAPVAVLAGLGIYAAVSGTRTPDAAAAGSAAPLAPPVAAPVQAGQPLPAATIPAQDPQAAAAAAQGLPADPAAAGMIWSSEHGHWHDPKKTAAPSQSPVVIDMQGAPAGAVRTEGTNVGIDANAIANALPMAKGQPGPAPEGKVWSTEHNHWHDKPKNLETVHLGTVNYPSQPVPQPGPAPAGTVWSEEHGHWHKAGATSGAPAATTTAPPPAQ